MEARSQSTEPGQGGNLWRRGKCRRKYVSKMSGVRMAEILGSGGVGWPVLGTGPGLCIWKDTGLGITTWSFFPVNQTCRGLLIVSAEKPSLLASLKLFVFCHSTLCVCVFYSQNLSQCVMFKSMVSFLALSLSPMPVSSTLCP